MASRAFVAALTCAAAIAVVAVVGTAAVTPNLGTLLGGLGLAAAFGVARALAIEVEVRRDNARITPTEIPLVFGLLYLPAPVVLAAYVGVVVIARLLRPSCCSTPPMRFSLLQ
jgi:predicted outer membrane lipoprotein